MKLDATGDFERPLGRIRVAGIRVAVVSQSQVQHAIEHEGQLDVLALARGSATAWASQCWLLTHRPEGGSLWEAIDNDAAQALEVQL